MAINNEIEVKTEGGKYIDSRDIKSSKDGIKVRLYGDQTMGYSYFQKQEDDKVKVIRSKEVPAMENPTDGYQGVEQTPAKALYSVAWDYNQEAPVLLTLDKVVLLKPVLDIEHSEDLGSMTDYDFRISFDNNLAPADKYKVVRLDKSELTDEQTTALKAFSEECNIESYADGGEAFEEAESKIEGGEEEAI